MCSYPSETVIPIYSPRTHQYKTWIRRCYFRPQRPRGSMPWWRPFHGKRHPSLLLAPRGIMRDAADKRLDAQVLPLCLFPTWRLGRRRGDTRVPPYRIPRIAQRTTIHLTHGQCATASFCVANASRCMRVGEIILYIRPVRGLAAQNVTPVLLSTSRRLFPPSGNHEWLERGGAR